MKIPDEITNCLLCNSILYRTSTCNCGQFQYSNEYVWILSNNELAISIDRHDGIIFFYVGNPDHDGYLLDKFSSIEDIIHYYNKIQVFK